MLINKIVLSDCIEGMKKIKDNSIHTIVADPPYNIGKDFGNDSDKQEMGEYLKWSQEWISEGYRTLTDGGSMFIYGFSEILAHIFVQIPNKNKKWLIWHYTNKTVPSLKDWQRSHESIIHMWKGDKKNFNLDDVREDYTKLFLKKSAGKKRKSTKGRFSKGEKETVYTANKNGALPRDVFKVPSLAGGSGSVERWFYCSDCREAFHPKDKKSHETHSTFTHPTQKPFELTKKLFLSSIPKDVTPQVIVPFAGSGSELVVAKSLGCDFIGFEINEKYVEFGNSWLNKFSDELPIEQ
jgi:site-specific DNA-methyltransferase (adenine-specific)